MELVLYLRLFYLVSEIWLVGWLSRIHNSPIIQLVLNPFLEIPYRFKSHLNCISDLILSLNVQSTLVISTSIISNNHLSRRENLVLVLTQKSKIRLQNIVEKRRNCSWGAMSPFPTIFSINISNYRSQITQSFVKFGCSNCFFLNTTNLVCRSTDISKCFRGSLRFRDNDSGLYFFLWVLRLLVNDALA